MKVMHVNSRPSVVWLEGVLDYFNTPFPHEPRDPRRIGFGVGRQLVGLYLVEMLLKHALDDSKKPYGRRRNLHDLFSRLPEHERIAVEGKYKQLLADGVAEAWDFARSVESFLIYLGDNAVTDSRYFWERQRPLPILFMGTLLLHLIYALFIALHQYPEGPPLQKRYVTKFIDFEDSLKNQQDPPQQDNLQRPGKLITAHIIWMEGLLTYFRVPVPAEYPEPQGLGFHVAQRMVGLHLSEMLLKYALDDLDKEFGYDHNLYGLFKQLPPPSRCAVARTYDKILRSCVRSTWEYARTVESLLRYLGHNAITDTRYYWEKRKTPVELSPGPLFPLVDALFMELHGYPQSYPLHERYETVFLPLGEPRRKNS